MLYLRREVTQTNVMIGPFVSAADGVTPLTDLDIQAVVSVFLSKNGADFVEAADTAYSMHKGDGWYLMRFTAEDLDTAGRLQLRVNMAGALPVWMDFTVLSAAVYDSLFGAAALALASDTDAIADVLPAVAAGSAGGLPTVDANNRIAGIAGTLNTLDALDDAQDGQHATTQANVAAIEVDTQDIQSRLPAALVGGKIVADMSAILGTPLNDDRSVGTFGASIAENISEFFGNGNLDGNRSLVSDVNATRTVVSSGAHGNAAIKTALDLKASQASVDAAVQPDDRDLESVQHEWKLKRSGAGVYRSTNPFTIAAGDTARVGWDCGIPAILPNGTVLSTMTLPTSSDAAEGVNVVEKLGVDRRVAKVEISADADAVAASYWITTKVTNSNGGGPVTVYGEVVVQAAP